MEWSRSKSHRYREQSRSEIFNSSPISPSKNDNVFKTHCLIAFCSSASHNVLLLSQPTVQGADHSVFWVCLYHALLAFCGSEKSKNGNLLVMSSSASSDLWVGEGQKFVIQLDQPKVGSAFSIMIENFVLMLNSTYIACALPFFWCKTDSKAQETHATIYYCRILACSVLPMPGPSILPNLYYCLYIAVLCPHFLC
jgi:hypothetical protein